MLIEGDLVEILGYLLLAAGFILLAYAFRTAHRDMHRNEGVDWDRLWR